MLRNILFFLVTIVLGVSVTRITPVQLPRVNPTKTVTFSIKNPPKEARTGVLSLIEGDVQIEARGATEPVRLGKVRTIVQGERLVTSEKSTTLVTFGNDTEILLEENTDIIFAQTIPSSIVLVQNTGTVTYSQNTDSIPLSIRVRNLLVSLKSGDFTVTLEDGDPVISVTVNNGEIKTAYNDSDFVSQVNTLSKGDEMAYDSDVRNAIIN